MAQSNRGKATTLDPRWAHCTMRENNKMKTKCNYCGKHMTGGIYRFKLHLVGIRGAVEKRTKVPSEVREEFKVLMIERMKKKETSEAQKEFVDDELSHEPRKFYINEELPDSNENDEENRQIRRAMKASRQQLAHIRRFGAPGPSSRRGRVSGGRGGTFCGRGGTFCGRGGAFIATRSASVKYTSSTSSTAFGERTARSSSIPSIDTDVFKKQGSTQTKIKATIKGIKDTKKRISKAIVKFFY
ncbi:hypothetical protein Droror1_Dr00009658 [Drosera rotundifolia]